MRWLFVVAVLGACSGDDGGPGVTSSSEHLEGTLPVADTLCFSQPLLDVQPDIAGPQYECSALLDGDVLPRCGAGQPCWEIVAGTMCTQQPSVPGGGAGQTITFDCLVEE